VFFSPVSGLHHGPENGVQASNEHLVNTAIGWATGRVPGSGGSEGVRHVYIFGCVVNGPTAGEVALSWAPNTLSAEYIAVNQHSALFVMRAS
jgi:hypothetical protein